MLFLFLVIHLHISEFERRYQHNRKLDRPFSEWDVKLAKQPQKNFEQFQAVMWFYIGTSTINGPGPLVHRSSSKCIHVKNGGFSAVPDGTGLVIYAGCYITGYEKITSF